MTKQTYKSAQGKTVDLGTIKLRNEHVRAVGNMNVNARGDAIDSNNQVVESKSRQIQRQNAQLTNVVDTPVHTSSAAAKRARSATSNRSATSTVDQTLPVVDTETMDATPPAVDTPAVDNSVTNDTTPDTNIPNSGGGLAAAIARSKIIKQEKEKTARQLAQENPGVRKI
jgi:hypothetical protein